jgi:hypothetical protein
MTLFPVDLRTDRNTPQCISHKLRLTSSAFGVGCAQRRLMAVPHKYGLVIVRRGDNSQNPIICIF